MAIEKQYDSSFGISFPNAYWCINSTRIEKPSKLVVVEVAIFADSSAKTSGFDPVGSQVFRLSQDNYDSVVNTGFSGIYNALKATYIQGGIDV